MSASPRSSLRDALVRRIRALVRTPSVPGQARAPGSWRPQSIAPSITSGASSLERKHEEIGYEIEAAQKRTAPDLDAALDDDVRRRPPPAHLHRLPSGALHRGPGQRYRFACSAA